MNQMLIQSLTGVGFPALFVLVLSALCFWLFKEHPRLRGTGIGLITAAGIFWAYDFASGGITYPPRETTDWLPYIAVVGALVGCIRFWMWRHFWGAALSLGTALTLFGYQINGNAGAVLWTLGVTLVLAVSATLLQLIEDRCSGAELSLGLAVAAGSGGIAMFLSGSAVLGQIAGAVGLMLSGIAILAFFANATVGSVLPFIYVFAFGSLLLEGCLLAGLPWISGVLLWIAPWTLLFGKRTERPKLLSRILALGLRMIGVVVLVCAALAVVFLLVQPSADY